VVTGEVDELATRQATRVVPRPVTGQRSLADLHAALERADFTTERIETVLGVGELSAAPEEAAIHRRRLTADDAFATIATLFLLGDPVPRPQAEAAFAPVSLDGLREMGLVELEGDRVRALVRLLPHGDYYLASDHIAAEPSSDWVAGIHAPSVTLAKLAIRLPVAATLDLGTGCGIQALLAAKHSERVIATDVNGRALAFARFNAALNGIDVVEFRQGDLFEPVEGERFGLVVANPPYVISPDTAYAYRDSELPGDAVCRHIVESVPAYLSEGGFAHILVSWAHAPGNGAEWAEPLRAWSAGTGCDAWLLHYRTDDPVTHAAGWLRPLARSSPEEYEAALERWLEYFQQLDIEAVGYGAVVLRRRTDASNWVRIDEIPIDRLEPATEHTLRVFAAETHLATLPDERALLEERFELVPAQRLEQQLVCRDGRFDVDSQTLALTEGLAFRAGLDRSTVMLLPHFDATRRLADVLAAAASDLGVEPEERQRYETAALAVTRRLFELGFLVRADG
jgi:methylase of polypeptide subunit release factors